MTPTELYYELDQFKPTLGTHLGSVSETRLKFLKRLNLVDIITENEWHGLINERDHSIESLHEEVAIGIAAHLDEELYEYFRKSAPRYKYTVSGRYKKELSTITEILNNSFDIVFDLNQEYNVQNAVDYTLIELQTEGIIFPKKIYGQLKKYLTGFFNSEEILRLRQLQQDISKSYVSVFIDNLYPFYNHIKRDLARRAALTEDALFLLSLRSYDKIKAKGIKTYTDLQEELSDAISSTRFAPWWNPVANYQTRKEKRKRLENILDRIEHETETESPAPKEFSVWKFKADGEDSPFCYYAQLGESEEGPLLVFHIIDPTNPIDYKGRPEHIEYLTKDVLKSLGSAIRILEEYDDLVLPEDRLGVFGMKQPRNEFEQAPAIAEEIKPAFLCQAGSYTGLDDWEQKQLIQGYLNPHVDAYNIPLFERQFFNALPVDTQEKEEIIKKFMTGILNGNLTQYLTWAGYVPIE
ncbi:hypothetical protein JXB41_03665 [Candidatus Woesearchaeota archaeon]|nr:hypothetical protein [Candidatus Woesearchaeota archaeon]